MFGATEVGNLVKELRWLGLAVCSLYCCLYMRVHFEEYSAQESDIQ
jgi:hypothetical protein